MPITGPPGFSANDVMENTGLDKFLVLNNEQFGRTCFCPNPLGQEGKQRERLYSTGRNQPKPEDCALGREERCLRWRSYCREETP